MPPRLLPRTYLRTLKVGLIILLYATAVAVGSVHAAGQTFLVNVVADHNDGACDSDCTLREAITAANADGTLDTINFQLPAPYTISLTTNLPIVTTPIVMDGSSQPGYSDTPIVTIDYSHIQSSGDGLTIKGSGVTIKALHIFFLNYALLAAGNNNIIVGNLLTTNTASGDVAAIIVTGSNNQIGGANPEDGNVIQGGVSGIKTMGSGSALIQGNILGTDQSLTAKAGGSDYGVILYSDNNIVGGTAPGEANVIANYGVAGVFVRDTSTNNRIQGNQISGSGITGIEFESSWLTFVPNGAREALSRHIPPLMDQMANKLQPYPVIETVSAGAGTVEISGSLTASNSAAYRIDFYANSYCSPSGHGDGETYLGGQDLATDGSGAGAFDAVFTATLPPGGNVTATATDSVGNTSEFSQCVEPGATDNPQTFTVSSANDQDDGVCDAAHCSLREAIAASNLNRGKDTIAFNIPGAAPHTIHIGGLPLPAITDPVVLDATMNPGYQGQPVIDLDGGGSEVGFQLVSGNSTVRGFVIRSFSDHDIMVFALDGNIIQGNYLGTNAAGASAASPKPADALYIEYADNTLIGGATAGERNVISGSKATGIDITQASGTVIQGNYIGTNASGSHALPNQTGIMISYGDHTLIGGDQPGQGNVVSGNSTDGILLDGASMTVQGNLIGTDATGKQAIGNYNGLATRNYYPGIEIRASDIHIGGSSPGARNVISGNAGSGLSFTSVSGSIPSTIQGNYVGVDITGTQPIGNQVGGIGIGAAGGDILIGGENPGEGNIIAYNGNSESEGNGISIYTYQGTFPTNDQIVGNLIYGNYNEDIALGGNSPIGNDNQDPDVGPNNLQNYPVMDSLVSSALSPVNGPEAAGGPAAAPKLLDEPLSVAQPAASAKASPAPMQVKLNGHINTTPNMTLRLEFFGTEKCDKYGHGRARRFLGSTSVTTDANGDASYSVTANIVRTDFISATATDVTGNTSILSRCIAPPAAPGIPVLSSPAQNLLTKSAAPTFSWGAASSAYTYHIQIARDKKFAHVVQENTAGARTFTAATLSDGIYYWRIQAINSFGVAGKWSKVRKLTVDTKPPAVPKLKLPLDLASGTTLTPRLAVIKGKDTRSIWFQIATTQAGLDTSPILSIIRTGASYTVLKSLGLAHGQTYFWRAAALDKAGNVSGWSPVWSFTTK